MLRKWIGVFLAALVASPACNRRPQATPVEAAVAEPETPLKVRAKAAESRDAERSLWVTGSLLADEQVTVSTKVAGRIARLHVDFGQPVRRGQLLAELDDRDYRIQLDRARAGLAQALARLGLKPEEADRLPQTTPAIEQARAMLEDAREKFESARQLIETGDIPRQRFVELQKAYEARKAALEAAQYELQAALAMVQAAKAEVAFAQQQLDETRILAPFDGAVAERIASAGEYVRPNDPIVRLVKSWPLRLRAEVPERAAVAVQPGSELTFRTDAVPGAEFHAVVQRINPVLDPRARTLTVEAVLRQPDRRLRPGMFVQVKLTLAVDRGIVVVPREAVYTLGGYSKVFVIRGGVAHERPVTPGREFGQWVEIQGADVRPGELVAVEKLETLVEGRRVETLPEASRRN